MREIVLKNGMVAKVSDDDYERLAAFAWSAVEGRRGDWYAVRMVYLPAQEGRPRRSLCRQMQRDVLDPDMTAIRWQFSDHINHDTLDNQRHNLRWRDPRGSILNTRMRLNNTSGYRGVSWDRAREMWRVCIMSFGVRHIRYRADLENAARAYNALALEYHGEHAQLNIIPGDPA